MNNSNQQSFILILMLNNVLVFTLPNFLQFQIFLFTRKLPLLSSHELSLEDFYMCYR